ncbi:MAG TPA: type 1 glutamine amidotransferase [Nitrosopumilaceae archaeon]|nr:type 1 glutamine amidotransferase [Nitrosopumilaceae archaeon]
MIDVLVIQNTRIEDSGILGKLLENDGFKIRQVFAKTDKLPRNDASFLIILGGSQSANDDLSYLRTEEQLIREFVSKEKPVLGICLGSQLIAKAFGATVRPGVKKEIGFYHDLIKDDTNSKLFLGFENPFTVFHWHGDTFDLPRNAVRLAHSNDYENQAFQLQTAVGIQFHLEVDESMINLWLDKTEEKLEKIPYIKSEKIRQDIDANISTVKKNMNTFYKNFKSTFNL